jgi:hypothetical protein
MFKLTVGADDLRLNHTVAVDIMYIVGKPVLHVVCEATHFQTARFLPKMTSQETWRQMVLCWTKMYLGPPYYLRIDQGSNLTADEFVSSAVAEGIEVLESTIESPASMTHTKRYHGPLRIA